MGEAACEEDSEVEAVLGVVDLDEVDSAVEDSLLEAVAAGVAEVALDAADLAIEAVGAIEGAGDIDALGDEDGGDTVLTGEVGGGPIGVTGTMDILTDATIMAVTTTVTITHTDTNIGTMTTHHTGGPQNRNGLQNELSLSLKKKRLLTTEAKNIGKYLTQRIAS